jgi:hypothetical protein
LLRKRPSVFVAAARMSALVFGAPAFAAKQGSDHQHPTRPFAG